MSLLKRSEPAPSATLAGYRHRVRVTVEGNEDAALELKLLLTAYFQLTRAGHTVEVHNDRGDGRTGLDLTWDSVCPEHEIPENAKVILEFTQAQRVEVPRPSKQGRP
jgi:hypothetical protein